MGSNKKVKIGLAQCGGMGQSMSEHLCLCVCMCDRGQEQVNPHPLLHQLLRRLEVGTKKHVSVCVCVYARVENG